MNTANYEELKMCARKINDLIAPNAFPADEKLDQTLKEVKRLQGVHTTTTTATTANNHQGACRQELLRRCSKRLPKKVNQN